MKTFFSLLSASLIVSLVTSASAAQLYWDPGMTGGTSGASGGNGNWDTNTTDAFWFNGSADVPWVNANNDDAYFTNGTGTATLTTNINAGDLYFTNLPSGGMVIANATGVETLTLANGVIDTGGTTDTISALLTGSVPLTKNGVGTLVLSGNNANAGLSGPVTVNQGALQITTVGAQGTAPVTVTNGGSFEINSGGTITNSFFISGNGANGEGALFATAAVTQSGLITMEATNVVFGGNSGVYDIEGGITNAGTNVNAVFRGGATFRVSYNTTTKPVNFGKTGSITVNSGQVNVEAASLTYSNLVLNGAIFASSLQDASLGLAPSKFEANNITMSNGAAIQESHTFTMNGNRGIYLGPGGGTIEDLTSSATLTVGGAISGPGNLIIALGKTGSGVKFTGNNTFSGTCTINGSTFLTVGNGSTLPPSGTLGTGNTVNNGTLTVDSGATNTYAGSISGTGNSTITSEANGDLTFSGPISTSGSLTINSSAASGAGTIVMSGPISTTGALKVDGAGMIVFSGANTYSANTAVECQFFMVNNTTGSGTSSGSVTVGLSTGGTFLGGTGIISGPVTVVAANTLQPGNVLANSLGTLTINNSLTLQAGSATVMNIDATVPACSSVVGMSSVTYGGTLTVNLINGTLAQGQTYRLFGAGSYSGTFEGGINLPALPAPLSWNTSKLAVNGTISVAGQNGVLNPPVLSGTNIILSGSEGTPSGPYSVLSTTNLLLPISSWNVLSTGNSFDSSGDFSFTNGLNTNTPGQFFMIRQP